MSEITPGITNGRCSTAPLDKTISAERVRKLFSYDSETGHFYWRAKSNNNGANEGDLAGSLNGNGYRNIGIDGLSYKAHRLAWLLTKGEWPTGELDHVDGNRSNNAISNLRIATRSQNNSNARRRYNNVSGFKGVSFHKGDKRWRATIYVNKKCRHLGSFLSATEAHAAYCRAARELHGEFARFE